MQKNPHILSQISTALTVLQLVSGVFVFGSGEVRALRLAGFLIWGIAVFLTLWPIYVFSTRGSVPDGENYMQTTALVDRGLYAIVRHPQYLGWIVWSYGLMLRVHLRSDTALGSSNPGASLPWVLSTLIIGCVALSEEIHMRRQHGAEYESYSNRAPFMLPLPRTLSRAISAPFRLVVRKSRPETGWDLVWVFGIYLALVALLSLPSTIL